MFIWLQYVDVSYERKYLKSAKKRKIFEENKFQHQAGFQPMITVPPAQP